jgi:hypothetical protein
MKAKPTEATLETQTAAPNGFEFENVFHCISRLPARGLAIVRRTKMNRKEKIVHAAITLKDFADGLNIFFAKAKQLFHERDQISSPLTAGRGRK